MADDADIADRHARQKKIIADAYMREQDAQIGLRVCITCRNKKTLDCFHSNITRAHGKNNKCKVCVNKNQLIYTIRRSMNQQKFESIYNNFSSTTKKIFDSIPKIETWDINKIIREHKRVTGGLIPQQTANGAVSSMVAAGIVTEPKRGQFMQTKINVKTPVNALKEIKGENKASNNAFSDLFALISDISVKISYLKTSAELAFMELDERLKEKSLISDDEKEMIELNKKMAALSHKMNK